MWRWSLVSLNLTITIEGLIVLSFRPFWQKWRLILMTAMSSAQRLIFWVSYFGAIIVVAWACSTQQRVDRAKNCEILTCYLWHTWSKHTDLHNNSINIRTKVQLISGSHKWLWAKWLVIYGICRVFGTQNGHGMIPYFHHALKIFIR